MWYKHKFLTRDKFDNFYITSLVEELDEKRDEAKKETILPLQGKEDRYFIYTGEPRHVTVTS